MPTDIKLDGDGGNSLVLEGAILRTTASDVIIDAPRALVHDQQDGLTVNFNGDYPGGVTVGGDLTVAGKIRWDSAADSRDLSEVIRDLQRRPDVARFQRLEAAIESMAALLDASIVPDWQTVDEVENGDDMQLLSPSAEDLGLVARYADRSGRILQGIPNDDFLVLPVLSLRPVAGTMLRRGSEVIVRVDFDG